VDLTLLQKVLCNPLFASFLKIGSNDLFFILKLCSPWDSSTFDIEHFLS